MFNASDVLLNLFTSRHSCREFLTDEVPQRVLKTMLTTARCAPSSANLQPGKFHVLQGEALQQLTRQLTQVASQNPPEPPEYSYFPVPLPEYLKQRQKTAGYALYQSLNIGRRDISRRREQFLANYRFFDAPVGIVVTMPRDMGKGGFIDLGMLLMSFLLLADSNGYGTCPIGALANYGHTLHHLLALDDDEMVVCGVALGLPNPAAAVNQFRTERLAVDDFAVFYTGSEQSVAQ
ncbi:MAG: Chloronitrobenzene nitroreductase [Candidatus Erwinia impunctatus]|nr:Chloronitrobenzene nitroreductase [Culicoides impunctatus]